MTTPWMEVNSVPQPVPMPDREMRSLRGAATRWAAMGLLLMPIWAHCDSAEGDAGVKSIYSSLQQSSCKEANDPKDIDDPPFLVCPGVGGYFLQIRLVESGRSSISVVTPDKKEFPLNYQEVISRSMMGVDGRAEWRIRSEAVGSAPLGLIVRVMVHGSLEDPAEVTETYWAVAKVGPKGACVTDRVREGTKTAAEVEALADVAGTRPCASPLPVHARKKMHGARTTSKTS